MTIGYIISDEQKPFGSWFEVISYADYNEQVHTPCLFIGVDKLSSFMGQTMDSVNRKLDDQRYYTFTKFEYRKHHESDVYDFKKICYENLIKGLNYYFVDPLLLSDEKYNKIIDKCLKFKDTITTMSYGDMYYISVNDTILGFNKNFQDFVTTDDDIFNTVIKESNLSFKGEDIILEYSEHLEMLDGNIKYLPYLCRINIGT